MSPKTIGKRTLWKIVPGYLLLTLCGIGLTSPVIAERMDLTLGLVRAGGQQYFVDLLQQSLADRGHEVAVNVLGNLPQKRMLYMMEQGELTLTWLVQSAARDNRYVPVKVGITGGLIGQRILLIPQGQEGAYKQVTNLEQFRRTGKVGVFGEGWFDIEVWHHNRLPYRVSKGAWQKTVYQKIADGGRGIDYFSRGIFEILEEAKAHPYLAIEPHLILVYDRDFRYYLSHSFGHYKSIIEEALNDAKQSGLMERLIALHWGEALQKLQMDSRTKIHLPVPQAK